MHLLRTHESYQHSLSVSGFFFILWMHASIFASTLLVKLSRRSTPSDSNKIAITISLTIKGRERKLKKEDQFFLYLWRSRWEDVHAPHHRHLVPIFHPSNHADSFCPLGECSHRPVHRSGSGPPIRVNLFS